ncbi:MAG: HU family DNA-binding protein [Oscillospiraceae bacterium]|nr:HU family DNA-binding protein [Oscillospiraceae bacterium]
MNKTELVKKVAEEAQLTQKQAAAALESVIGAIESAVAAGEKVTLPGFGTFEKRFREARTGRNPRTGEATQIAASSAPAFKAGKAFKDQVNK